MRAPTLPPHTLSHPHPGFKSVVDGLQAQVAAKRGEVEAWLEGQLKAALAG